MVRVLIVGSGRVGRAAGYALASMKLNGEVVFYDRSPEVAKASAEDVSHAALCFTSQTRVTWSEEPVDADVVLVAASVPRRGVISSRMELLEANAKIIADVAEKVYPAAPRAWYVVVTNPVEVMATLLAWLTGTRRVIATSTFIDEARLKYFLSTKLGAQPHEVSCLVGGIHGEDPVILWSTATLKGEKLIVGDDVKAEAREYLVKGPWEIIRILGMTAFGAGAMCARVIANLLAPAPVFASLGPYDGGACVGIPCAIGQHRVVGVTSILSADEREAIEARREAIKEAAERAEASLR